MQSSRRQVYTLVIFAKYKYNIPLTFSLYYFSLNILSAGLRT